MLSKLGYKEFVALYIEDNKSTTDKEIERRKWELYLSFIPLWKSDMMSYSDFCYRLEGPKEHKDTRDILQQANDAIMKARERRKLDG